MTIYLFADRAHLPIIQQLENRYVLQTLCDTECGDETTAAN